MIRDSSSTRVSVGLAITASARSNSRRLPAGCRAERARRAGRSTRREDEAAWKRGSSREAPMRWLTALDEFSRRHLTKDWTDARRRQFIANLCVASDEPSEPKAVQRALDQ